MIKSQNLNFIIYACMYCFTGTESSTDGPIGSATINYPRGGKLTYLWYSELLCVSCVLIQVTVLYINQM